MTTQPSGLDQLEMVFANGAGELIQGYVNQRYGGPVSIAPLAQGSSSQAALLTQLESAQSSVWLIGAAVVVLLIVVLVR